MIKKLMAVIIAALLMAMPATAFTDIYDDDLASAADTLQIIGVLDGMGDGSYRPGDYVTREQFAKIAVSVLGQKDKVSASPAATVFTDVDPNGWSRGYIAYVAETGIIAGFPDGSFGGAQVITYAQAVTVLMRCLGYSDGDIGFHWPTDYVNKAAALGLNKGVSLFAGDNVTRGDMALLVYNALFIELNGSSDKLVTRTGFRFYDDALIYGLNRSDSSVIETSEGSFRLSSAAVGIDGNFGKAGFMLINKDNELILFKSENSSGKEIVVTSCLNNIEHGTVDIGYSGGIISIPYSGTVYHNGARAAASDIVADITIGSRMNIYYDERGAYKSGVLYSYTMLGPATITVGSSQIYDLFNISGVPTVIRGGAAAKASDISIYDVVYYDENTNTVYAYTDKVSGIYEKASPLKSTVTEVTVSGKTYSVATSAAMNKLNESASAFALGDYVTLLLDRNGAIADVVDTSASVGRNLGVLLNAYTRLNKGTQEYAVKMILPDGAQMEYPADRDYSRYKGKLMEMTFKDGVVSLIQVNYVSASGSINKELRTFDGKWLTSDCSVLVLVDNPENGDAVVRKIRFSDIDGTSLSKDQVIHMELSGEMNDVSLLFLKDVSKSEYEYGIIVNSEVVIEHDENGNIIRRKQTGSYEVLLHGETISINAGRRVFSTPVIGIKTVGGTYTDAIVMGRGEKISAVSGDRIKVGSTVYRTAESYDIYRLTDIDRYTLISAEEAMRLPKGTVEVYGDDTVSRGGKVRLIIIK